MLTNDVSIKERYISILHFLQTSKKQLRNQRKMPELPSSNVAEFKNQNNR